MQISRTSESIGRSIEFVRFIRRLTIIVLLTVFDDLLCVVLALLGYLIPRDIL